MYLNIENIVKYYSKDNPLINGLNFYVNKGEFVSFVGESGSGKTTFLKCLAGLENINSGKITLNDKVLNDKDTFVKPNFRKIGFIFQDYPLFPHLTVLENLKINLDGKYESNIDYYTNLTGLTNFLNRFPHELSGGEQQRVAVARALINSPSIILADEPSGNLDSKNAEELHNLFLKLNKELGQTFVIITHNKQLANLGNRKLEMKDGKII